jgi:Tfp pilus assembly protein PilV
VITNRNRSGRARVASSPLSARARLRTRDGFTIVEIIVAIMVLSVGVLGLAATAAVVQKQMASGERQAAAAAIAQSRFDQLTSINCKSANLVGGTQTWRNGHVKETWTVTAGSNVKLIQETIQMTGYKNNLVYTTYIPCRN